MLTARDITLTLTGDTTHLVGYAGFSAQEVRRFAPHRAPGPRCLVGGFHRQPEMNVATPVALRSHCRALLVAGRAFDPAHDLHVPLVHEPGHVVRVALLAPPPPAHGELDRLAQQFAAVEWIWARSYANTDAEHFYSRREAWPSDEVFVAAVTALKRHGYRARFRGAWWQQIDVAGWCYWGGFERADQHRWLNRRALSRPPVPISVSQQLIAENARMLDVPAGPDRWQAVAEALFGAPPDGAGVAPLFAALESTP